MPTVLDRSSLICTGSIAGAIALVCWLALLPRRARWVMLAALGGFIASQTLNAQLWQRYHEPFILMWIAVCMAIALGSGTCTGSRKWSMLGPCVLALVLTALTLREIAQSSPGQDEGVRIGHIFPSPTGSKTPAVPKSPGRDAP
jgi:hypothetical protein